MTDTPTSPVPERPLTVEEKIVPILKVGVEIRNDAVELMSELVEVKPAWYRPAFYRDVRAFEQRLSALNRRFISFDTQAIQYALDLAMIRNIREPDGEPSGLHLGHVVKFGYLANTALGNREYIRSDLDRIGATLAGLRQQSYNQFTGAIAVVSLIIAVVALVVSAVSLVAAL